MNLRIKSLAGLLTMFCGVSNCESGASPTWGHVYSNEKGKLRYKGIALYKGFDYDSPKSAYNEKIWSILGNEIVGNDIRIPNIDIVEQKNGLPETISYILMNNDQEDMIHLKDTLFYKFEREEIKAKRDVLTINELLECVKLQINNDENYRKIEKNIINVLLLDAITNNGDRHGLNWALIRNKTTNAYDLAVYDHASAFFNMTEDRDFFDKTEWSSSYITVGKDRGRNSLGSDGKRIIEFLSKEYPNYFCEFCNNFNEKLPKVLDLIRKEQMKIDFKVLERKLKQRNNLCLNLVREEKKEREYGE